MKHSSRIAGALLTTLILVGCLGGKTPIEQTVDSSDLTGLWVVTDRSLSETSGFTLHRPFTITQNGDDIHMTDCSSRDSFTPSLSGNTFSTFPDVSFTLDWLLTDIGNGIYDNMSANGITSSFDHLARKVSLSTQFNMGTFRLSSPELEFNALTDVCVVQALDEEGGLFLQGEGEVLKAVTRLNGEVFTLMFVVPGMVSEGEYRIGVVDVDILELSWDGFQDLFGDDYLKLTDGTLEILVNTEYEIQASFTGTLPNGSALTGTFDLIKPVVSPSPFEETQ